MRLSYLLKGSDTNSGVWKGHHRWFNCKLRRANAKSRPASEVRKAWISPAMTEGPFSTIQLCGKVRYTSWTVNQLLVAKNFPRKNPSRNFILVSSFTLALLSSCARYVLREYCSSWWCHRHLRNVKMEAGIGTWRGLATQDGVRWTSTLALEVNCPCALVDATIW